MTRDASKCQNSCNDWLTEHTTVRTYGRIHMCPNLWQDTQLSVTKGISSDQMQDNLWTKEMITLPNFPSHAQVVERIIEIVTDVSVKVVGEEFRNGYERARIEGRKKLPKFESKKTKIQSPYPYYGRVVVVDLSTTHHSSTWWVVDKFISIEVN